jgi:chorismate mutase
MSSSCHAFARSPSFTKNPWNSQLSATKADPVVSGEKELNVDKDNLTTSDVLSLDSIRSTLIRQEETIIFALIERAQFRHNPIVYQKGGFGALGTPPGSRVSHDTEPLSFLEYMLMGTEALHYVVRRYASPEEHAFFPDRLPSKKKVLQVELEYPQDLLSSIGGASDVNFNPILLEKYINVIVPSMAVVGDDEQHGSTALCDVTVLQALSRRVHYGKFVAESKYLGDPEEYQRLVEAGDAEGVMKLLTNEVVEAKVLRRARLKAATYGTEPLLAAMPPLESSGSSTTMEQTSSIVAAAAASAVKVAIEAMGDDNFKTANNKVCPATVESVYRDIIIPLTKDIEVAYLFRRCGKEPPKEYRPDRMSTDIIHKIE